MEIEAKYAIGDPDTFDRLRLGEPAGRYKFVYLSEHDASDTYLDTAQQHLLRAGWVLRVREGVQPGRASVTLKSRGRTRGAIHRREEIEMMIPAGTPAAAWPAGALVRKVRELTDGEPLAEALRLRQHRVLHDVRRAKRTVAVRFLDQVVFEAGSRMQTSLEMEVELTGLGSLEDLHALDELLRADHVQPEGQSKFERALAWVRQPADGERTAGGKNGAAGPVAPRAAAVVGTPVAGEPGAGEPGAGDPGTGEPGAGEARPVKPPLPLTLPEDDILDAGRRVLSFHKHRMFVHEPGVRRGDADALHDMRVAVRRQRALLRILSPWIRAKTVRRFRGRLRDAGAALGAVRDLDVAILAADGYAARHGRGRVAALQPVLAAWNGERAQARARLVEFLDAAAWRKFCARYEEFLDSPPGGGPAAGASSRNGTEHVPHRVAHVLPAAIWSHYAALRACEPGTPSVPFEVLHRLRIEAKHLRYLLEFFQSALDPCPLDALRALVALQDHLGSMNDAHVAAARVRSLLEAEAAAGSMRSLLAIRAYLEHLLAERDRRRAEFEPLWGAVAGTAFKEQLARACARL